jgi:hypothetical protein
MSYGEEPLRATITMEIKVISLAPLHSWHTPAFLEENVVARTTQPWAMERYLGICKRFRGIEDDFPLLSFFARTHISKGENV